MSRPATTPVLLVVTTQHEDDERRDLLEAGADACLLKPCDITELGQSIVEASRHRLRLVPPDPYRAVIPRDRLRQAVRRSRAISERLAAAPDRSSDEA